MTLKKHLPKSHTASRDQWFPSSVSPRSWLDTSLKQANKTMPFMSLNAANNLNEGAEEGLPTPAPRITGIRIGGLRLRKAAFDPKCGCNARCIRTRAGE